MKVEQGRLLRGCSVSVLAIIAKVRSAPGNTGFVGLTMTEVLHFESTRREKKE